MHPFRSCFDVLDDDGYRLIGCHPLGLTKVRRIRKALKKADDRCACA